MACKGILIVEDDIDIRESVKQLLEFEGFTVHTAQNGKEALEVVKTLHYPCLILLDLMMPVMTGWEFLEIQQNDNKISTIPVVIATASEDSRARSATGVLRKPIDVDRLVEIAAKYCSGAQTLAPHDKAA